MPSSANAPVILPPSPLPHFLKLQTLPCSAAELWSWKTLLYNTRALLPLSRWACRPSLFREPSEVGQMVRKLMGLCEVTERVTRVSLQDCSGLSRPDSDRFPCNTLNQGPAALCSRKPIKSCFALSPHAYSWLRCINNVATIQKVLADRATQKYFHVLHGMFTKF